MGAAASSKYESTIYTLAAKPADCSDIASLEAARDEMRGLRSLASEASKPDFQRQLTAVQKESDRLRATLLEERSKLAALAEQKGELEDEIENAALRAENAELREARFVADENARLRAENAALRDERQRREDLAAHGEPLFTVGRDAPEVARALAVYEEQLARWAGTRDDLAAATARVVLLRAAKAEAFGDEVESLQARATEALDHACSAVDAVAARGAPALPSERVPKRQFDQFVKKLEAKTRSLSNAIAPMVDLLSEREDEARALAKWWEGARPGTYRTSLEGGEPPSVAELMGGPPVVMRVETTLPLPELAPAADEGEALRIDDVIANVRDDAAWADKILPTLPIEWKEYLTSDEFIDSAMDKFDALDADGNEKLSPDELVPVVSELSQGQPWDIDDKHCVEFAEIFDADKNGFIDRGEFFRFVQFLVVMSHFSSPEAEVDDIIEEAELDEALRIDDVIANVRDDAAWADKILPSLPIEWKDYLFSEQFVDDAMNQFDALDVDCSGALTPDELVPVVAELSSGRPWDIDEAHCLQFAEIFDKDKNGVIDRGEFFRFVQFLVVMSFASSAEAEAAAAAAESYEVAVFDPWGTSSVRQAAAEYTVGELRRAVAERTETPPMRLRLVLDGVPLAGSGDEPLAETLRRAHAARLANPRDDAAIARKLAEELRDTKDELERLKRSYARAADDGAKARRLLADANQALRNEREKAPTGAALSQLLDGLPPAVAARVIQELRATVSVYSGFGARYGL